MRRNVIRTTFCLLLGVTIFILFLNCQDTSTKSFSDLDTLASWMNGSFSSAEQATNDSDYFDVRLQMIPIWDSAVMAIGSM